MNQTFPAGFKVKDTSVMFGDVKERKIVPKKEKVEGETLKLKMKDIVRETFDEIGNPVSFAQVEQIYCILVVNNYVYNGSFTLTETDSGTARIRIPNQMATLYYADPVHIAHTRTDLYCLFLCRTEIRVHTRIRLRQCK